jgi:diguanylate cyclase (GGDEF)-like protein
MNKILKWLGVQDAFNKGLLARILVILCLIFIVFGAIFVVSRFVLTLLPGFPAPHWTDLLIESVIFLIGMITLWFIRRDKMRAANRVILGGLLFVVSLQAYFLGDPTSDITGAMGLLLFAFLAILLLDRGDRWVAIILVVSVFIGLMVLASSGNVLPARPLTPFGKILLTLFVWGSVGSIIAIIMIAAMGATRREPHLIQQQIDELDQAKAIGDTRNSLTFLSTHDALTGLYNRLFFEAEFARLEKSRLFPISIITAEIVDLKGVNDAFGKNRGDQVLINLSSLFLKVFRQEDIITRYGGVEFVILLPGADAAVVKAVLGRIDKQLDAYNKTHKDLPLRIILGTSTAIQGESLKEHLKLAGKNMQEEKSLRSGLDSTEK